MWKANTAMALGTLTSLREEQQRGVGERNRERQPGVMEGAQQRKGKTPLLQIHLYRGC